MNRSKVHSSTGLRNGLTLIEVVVGIGLAGTLLVSIMMAATGHRKQLRQMRDRQVAMDAIDRFLSQWARYEFSDQGRERSAKQCGVHMDGLATVAVSRGMPVLKISTRATGLGDDYPFEIARVEAWVGGGEVADSWVEVLRGKELR